MPCTQEIDLELPSLLFYTPHEPARIPMRPRVHLYKTSVDAEAQHGYFAEGRPRSLESVA